MWVPSFKPVDFKPVLAQAHAAWSPGAPPPACPPVKGRPLPLRLPPLSARVEVSKGAPRDDREKRAVGEGTQGLSPGRNENEAKLARHHDVEQLHVVEDLSYSSGEELRAEVHSLLRHVQSLGERLATMEQECCTKAKAASQLQKVLKVTKAHRLDRSNVLDGCGGASPAPSPSPAPASQQPEASPAPSPSPAPASQQPEASPAPSPSSAPTSQQQLEVAHGLLLEKQISECRQHLINPQRLLDDLRRRLEARRAANADLRSKVTDLRLGKLALVTAAKSFGDSAAGGDERTASSATEVGDNSSLQAPSISTWPMASIEKPIRQVDSSSPMK